MRITRTHALSALAMTALPAIGSPATTAAVQASGDLRPHGRFPCLASVDGHDLIGIVTLADVARALPDAPVHDLPDALTSDRSAPVRPVPACRDGVGAWTG
ncbi:hypothetical protein [Streptosporangium subroseum]|uniref:hypothetical protein n=1 Tax=Streptosporangium subroseum TaxID=106412 RepID=UPI00308E3622|nr:hypothetical protein OHB15_17335 [Streptosporangium subroseum]